PDRVAEVGAEVDAREHEIDALPVVRTEGDTVGGRSVDSIRLEIADSRLLAGEGPARRDRVTHGRLLHVRCHDPHVPKVRGCFCQGDNAWAIDAIVIRNQYSHLATLRSPPRILASACASPCFTTRKQGMVDPPGAI